MRIGFVLTPGGASFDAKSTEPEDVLFGEKSLPGESVFGADLNQSAVELVEQLRQLNEGQYLFVDHHGLFHHSKGELYKETSLPWVTFTRQGNSLIVTNGINSLHGTRVNNGPPLVDCLSISPPADLTLADLTIKITETLPAALETAIGLIQRDITKLEVGERIIIGRIAIPFLDDVKEAKGTSRIHCTVQRVEDIQTPTGESKRVYQIRDGRPADMVVLVDQEDSWQEVKHREIVQPGRKIRLGIDGPEIEIKSFKDVGPDEDPELLHACLAGDSAVPLLGHELPLGSQSIALSGSLFFRNPDLDLRKAKVSPMQAAILGLHIKEGLILIKNECYTESMDHFRQEDVLKQCGYKFSENHCYSLSKISGKRIMDVLALVAADSWFRNDFKLVYPSYADLAEGVTPKNERQQMLLKSFYRELGLLYAEEWTHCYQHALGTNVSRKGELIEGAYGYEVDVAQFFRENAVPLSYVFLAMRYPERNINLARLEGFQCKEELKEIRDLLLALDIEQSLVIGSNPEKVVKGAANVNTYTIKREINLAGSEFEQLKRKRAKDYHTLHDAHVTIQKTASGLWSIERGSQGFSANAEVFKTDASRIWRRAAETITASSGSPLRLGRYFELRLP